MCKESCLNKFPLVGLKRSTRAKFSCDNALIGALMSRGPLFHHFLQNAYLEKSSCPFTYSTMKGQSVAVSSSRCQILSSVWIVSDIFLSFEEHLVFWWTVLRVWSLRSSKSSYSGWCIVNNFRFGQIFQLQPCVCSMDLWSVNHYVLKSVPPPNGCLIFLSILSQTKAPH